MTATDVWLRYMSSPMNMYTRNMETTYPIMSKSRVMVLLDGDGDEW